MRRQVLGVWLLIACAGLAGVAQAEAEQQHKEMPPYSGSAEFERMKDLVGEWTGHNVKTSEEVTISYRLTSGDSAIVETLGAGTPHEMVSVYHDKAGQLAMTHYCMLGNQPELGLIEADGQRLTFDYTDGNGLNVATDPHMHGLTITFANDNTITQDWTFYEAGSAKEVHSFALTRVQ